MRVALTWMSALVLCGCLGRAKPDLLQARLREQQERVVEVERRMEAAQADLQRARRESDQLRAELARSGKQVMAAEYTESLIRASKLQINSMLSGGLNRDSQPGDDAVVAFFALTDDDGEVVKLPGAVELTLLDPSLPEPSRQVGQWRFTAEECRSKWTRGFTGSGFQFTVPLDQPVQHDQLVLNAKLTTVDNRIFDSSQLVRVTVADGRETVGRVPNSDELPPQPLDDINDPPPAAGDPTAGEPRQANWADDDDPAPQKPQVPSVEDSTNWMKDDFPKRY
ncbi:MAG: hypothetical protein JSS49_26430 [Planctomycetes bacterium]|nr:hypothetical protein [Planctomycetota bacterium]